MRLQISQCNFYLFPVLVFGSVFIQLLRSERWYQTFASNWALKRCNVYRSFLLGGGASVLLPWRAGDLVRAGLLVKNHTVITMGLVLGSMLIEKIADFIVILLLLFSIIYMIDLPYWVNGLAQTGSLIMFAVIAFVFLLSCGIHAFQNRLHQFGHGLLQKCACAVSKRLQSFNTAFRQVANLKSIYWIFVLSVIIWLSEVAMVQVCMYALGLQVHIAASALIVILLAIGSMMPSAPGFVGTYQWFIVTALGLFGIAETPAFAVGVIMNFNLILTNTLLCLLALSIFRSHKSVHNTITTVV